jgi:hypothetical protein
MYPGFEEQARALVDQALDDAPNPEAPVLILGPEGERIDRLVGAVQGELRGRTQIEPLTIRYRPDQLDAGTLAVQVRESGSRAVFFFGRQHAVEALLSALAASEQDPRIYLLSSFVSRPQIAAYAAAKLMVEGLRRAGRKLDRFSLVEGLEALYAFETGLTPPLTYGPNRRIGALGAHVVAVDLMQKTYEPVGGWHELP